MSAKADLQEDLRRVAGRIDALGSPPDGDPDALNRYAHALREEADTAASLGRLEAAVPGDMVFDSRGARRLAANVADVSESFFVAQRMLEQAAHTIRHKANELRDAQEEWARQRSRLDGLRADLEQRIARAKS